MAVIEAIATTYLEADAASVTFSSIPQTYEHLQLRMTEAATGVNGTIRMQFNDDTASNYSYHNMYGSGGSAGAAYGSASDSNIYIIGGTTADSAAFYGSAVIDILDYVNANKNTTVQILHMSRLTQASPFVVLKSGLWDDTAAVTKIKIDEYDGLKRGCSFTLYGLNSA